MAALLEAKNVTKTFGSGDKATVAVDQFSLALGDDTASFTTIAGESGSGKTTIARLLLGFTSPSVGEVCYRGKSLASMSRGEMLQFRHEVQAIFQDPFSVFNPFYRVDHLLRMPIRTFHLARSSSEARAKIEEALTVVGLRPEETLGRFPHQLSGGQRQRLTIARALLLRPRLIIADEPVSMVDASLRATILESLKRLNEEFGISFIYITHDLTTAYQISKNIIVLYRGAVAEVGDVELVIKDPKHPYSQLLVSSIPDPDVSRRWDDAEPAAMRPMEAPAKSGCRYVDRCPFAMPMCRDAIPPLYRIDRTRAAACFLHREEPVLSGDSVSQLLAPAAAGAA